MRAARALPLIAAPALAAMFVITAFIANGMTVQALVRPLLIAVSAAAVVVALFVAVIGRERGAFWAFIATSILTGMYVAGGASVLALAILQWRRSVQADAYRLASFVATGVAVSLLVILAIRGAIDGAFESDPIETPSLTVGSTQAGPSIHVLLLDGYPRKDALAELGFDNSPFLDAIEDRGFGVYPDSLSNYDRTPFAILSILSARHVADIDPLWSEPIPIGTAAQERRVARALLDPPLFTVVEGAGYQTRALTGTVVHVPIGGADVIWNAGTANNFELVLLQRTPLAGVLEWFDFATGQQRTHIEETLREFGEVPSVPTFTFAHVMAPHAPQVFNSDGTAAKAPPCYPERCAIFDGEQEDLGWTHAEYAARFTSQIAHLNDLVVQSIDDLVARDPNAVVVILSDHGIEGDTERFHHLNLVVARTPGHPGLLGEAPTNVNVIPMVLNAYLGTDIPLQPDTLYRSGESPWLSVEAIN